MTNMANHIVKIVGVVTRNTHVKYQSFSTHCSNVISRINVLKISQTPRSRSQGCDHKSSLEPLAQMSQKDWQDKIKTPPVFDLGGIKTIENVITENSMILKYHKVDSIKFHYRGISSLYIVCLIRSREEGFQKNTLWIYIFHPPKLSPMGEGGEGWGGGGEIFNFISPSQIGATYQIW